MSVPPSRPGTGPPPYDQPHEAAAIALQEVPRTLSEARRRFLAVNGAVLLVSAALSGTAGELFSARLASRMPLGVVLGVLQLVTLMLTAWRYDRTLRRDADPLVDLVRRHADGMESSPPPSDSLEGTSRWSPSPRGWRR
ncbi:DUF485 domain-containing protein [Streptomyces zhihengii]